jgi:threonine synthase
MDISVSSNFERFLFDLLGRDASKTAQKFEELRARNSFTVTPAELAAARSQFTSFSIDETQTLNTIRNVFTSSNYLLCPHSAVGLRAALQFRDADTFGGEDVVVLATAHIGKFAEGVMGCLNGSGDDALREALRRCVPAELQGLDVAGSRRFEVENCAEEVKTYMRQRMGGSA